MGQAISKTVDTNRLINEQMTKVITNSFSSCEMESAQGQTTVIQRNKNSNIDIDQTMTLKVIATCEITNEVTNDIKKNLDSFLTKKVDVETSASLLGLSYTSNNFLTEIKNKLSTEMTTNTISKIQQSVKASQLALLTDNEDSTIKVTQNMAGDIVMKALIQNKVINKIINDLKTRVELDYKTSTSASGFNFFWILMIGAIFVFAALYFGKGIPILKISAVGCIIAALIYALI